MKARSVALTFLLLVAVNLSPLAQTEITLVGITNVTHDSLMAGGSTHTLTLRYDLTGAPVGRNYLVANGWKIYSPDGADWEFVQGTALQAFLDVGWDYSFVNHFDKTGGTGSFGLPRVAGGGNSTGTDTVAVLLAGMNAQPGGGLPGGSDNFIFNIEFNSRREDAGLHICFDTTRQAPGASWEWANADGLIVPDWSGAKCWVIGCCSGQVGDINGVGGDEPTIGDISSLIDYLFLDGDQPGCLEESDVNQSGTLINPPLDWDDVTIGDVSYLIDYLFINHPPLPVCP